MTEEIIWSCYQTTDELRSRNLADATKDREADHRRARFQRGSTRVHTELG
jgi:hypothetical protein